MSLTPTLDRLLLSGTLTTIRYRDPRTGRSVVVMTPEEGGEPFTAVGVMVHEPVVGDALLLTGSFEEHPRWGRQFRIEGTVDPAVDAAVAEGYMGSGLLPHVGPATAAAIVGAFGAETLRVAAFDPDRLLGFRGITAERLPGIKRALRSTLHLAPVVGLIDPHGVSLRVARRVHRRYGAAAVEMIRAHPWRLAAEIGGIGFRTADKIAAGLGADPASGERMEAAVLQSLRDAAVSAGHTVVPRGVTAAAAAAMVSRPVDEAEVAIARLLARGELVASERPEGIATARLAAAERIVALRIRVAAAWHDATDPVPPDDAEIDSVATYEGVPFDSSQRAAIASAFTRRVSVITGNPGTGKTTIVRAIIEMAERRGLKIALASPTGRAAKRLSEATGRPAATIHRYLRYHPEYGFRGPLEMPDLIVIDEASMLDIPIAARLFEPLAPWTRLIFVGDADQLPAVGPGNLIADLLRSPIVGVNRLVTIHRTEQGSGVPGLSAQIRNGVRAPHFDDLTTRFEPQEEATEVADAVVAFVERNRRRAHEIQVIAPGRKGPAGVDLLNRRLQELLNPAGTGLTITRGATTLRIGDRVIVTGNDYTLELFNGDVGYLRAIHEDGSFTVEMDGAERVIPASGADLFELAYALTVHKAQGSEFPTVVIPLHTSAYLLLERRMLYTAVSRAKRSTVIIGQPKAMAIAIGRHDPAGRRTQLRHLIANHEPPTLILRDIDEEPVVVAQPVAAPATVYAGVPIDDDDLF
jgi:exodeoxyribonuclease V alpha subunit